MSDIECEFHSIPFSYICNQCNILFCFKCIDAHIQDSNFKDHVYEHIDDIRNSLSEIKINSKNSISSDTHPENKFKIEIESIWSNIKSLTHHLNSLEEKEDEITRHFKELHDYLIQKEYKLKKFIVEDIKIFQDLIDVNLNKLKSYINIININNDKKLNNNKNNNNSNNNNSISNDDKGVFIPLDSLSSSTSSSHSEIRYDTTDQYTLDSIIKSIKECESLNEFIYKNNETIFNQQQYTDNLEAMNECFNRNVDLIILQFIHQHNLKFDYNNNTSRALYRNYLLTVDNNLVKRFKEFIPRMIQVSLNTKESPYILALYNGGKSVATCLHIGDSFTVEKVKFDYNKFNTFNSFVKIGGHIYIFGGKEDKDFGHHFCKYSTEDKEIIIYGEIDGVEGGFGISACYDGKESIYLVNGYRYADNSFIDRVDRFNINSNRFERVGFSGFNDIAIISVFYKGLLYSIPCKENKVYIYYPLSKITKFYTHRDLFTGSIAACYDGNGWIYIHSKDKKFIKFNVDTKESKHLSGIDRVFAYSLSMVYYSRPNSFDYIFLFGGKLDGNFMYNIDTNQWIEFFKDDEYNRRFCGSILIDG